MAGRPPNPRVLVNVGASPRVGTFEVRHRGRAVVSLVGMPSPFQKLIDLDVDEVARQILAADALS